MTGALVLERLRVGRMPGVHDAGFEIDGLAAGLNVVHGPNGSGKTTTARAIEAVLWPRTAPERCWVAAHARLGAARWSIDVDGGRARYQRDGVDADALVAVPAEARDRYRLSLHELLEADDRGFAAAVGRESAGGYDLMAAAAAIGASGRASRCARELSELRQARVRLEAARGAQEALQTEERRLRLLEAELGARDATAARVRLVEAAIEHARTRDETAAAAQALAGFDARMQAVRGDEADALRALAAREAPLLEEAQRAHDAQRLARERCDACRLPQGGLPGELLPAARDELDALRDAARTIAAQAQAHAAAAAHREEARRALGADADEARLRTVDVGGVGALADFAHAADRLAAQRAALEARIRTLTADAEPAQPPEALERAAWLLQGWLRSGADRSAGERRLRALGLAAAAVAMALGLALGLVTPALALSALAGVALAVLMLRRGEAADPRPGLQADYGATGAEPPAAWTDTAVAARLARLHAEIARAKLDEERERQRLDARRELDALAPQEAELDVRRRQLAGRLGAAPAAGDAALVWTVERIGRWKDAYAAALAADAAREAAEAERARLFARAAARLAPFVDAAPADAAALAGAVDDLEQRQLRHREAALDAGHALERLASARQQLEALAAEQAALFARLRLEPGDAASVEAWCAAHAAYAAAQDELRRAGAAQQAAAARLTALPTSEPALLEADAAPLADELERLRERAEALERVHDEAIRVHTRVADAKRAHAIEDALAEVERCEDALRAVREHDVRAAVAALLVGHVQRETRDVHLPQVFHRARAWFARVTHGRYRLDFDDDDAPAFRAYDTTTGTGHPLGELSSATRVQLLMAVRWAFIETQETGARLPLVFDETLGNSDDERAHAIMHAVLELAAVGRQVFYFTAQPDEVGKWRGVLEARPDVASAVIDLGAVRRVGRKLDLGALRIVAPPAPALPAPDGDCHTRYGEALGVPRLDAFRAVDTAHLWYLVEEPRALHHLLGTLRVECWGALRLLVEHGGDGLVEPALFARTAALARTMETALELRAVGRGRPVDRAAIEASGAVSDAFVDTVDRLCERYGREARPLLDALGRGEAPRFRQSARDGLAQYLEEHGHLDDREPLGGDELRARTLAAAAPAIAEGLVDVAAVDRLLARIGVVATETPLARSAG